MASPDFEQHRERRAALAAAINADLGPFAPAHLRALVDVPRERFVRPEDVEHADLDAPLALDDSGQATISAPHAYLMTYRALDLREGDRLLELGSGTGYGAALAAEIVGARGAVLTIEIDEALARAAHELLAPLRNVIAIGGDGAAAAGFFAEYNKIVAAFSVDPLPRAWCDALRPGAVLVAPVGAPTQKLVRVERDERGAIRTTEHGSVRYVPNRSR
jgi:protein-L-isoaspartate(D-aspartate) O-methyltransferase